MIGQTLSHYRIVEQIGAGGMGVVYRARDEQLERDVALKVLPAGHLDSESSRSRFRKEGLALAKLDHPNIATVFEFGTQDNLDFLVTAYIPGVTLDVMLASKPLPEAETVGLGLQLAKGLAAAHENGVIHRDLKPGNLRLTPDGLLKILDFGLARFVATKEGLETTTSGITQSQEIAGTLPYMAPEQLRAGWLDARTDIWAAGVVLYEMVTGKRPFPQGNGPSLVDAILNSPPTPPRELNKDISPGFENVILKALEKDPAHRYQTATELGADLELLLAGDQPAAKRRKRARWRTYAALALLLLVAGAIGGYLLRPKPPTATRRSVAVLGFKNLSGKPEAAWISTALSEMLTTELGAGGRLRTVPGETVARTKADLAIPDSESLGNETLAKVYDTLGSNLVVLGSYLDINGQIRVDLRVQDTSAGETIATASEQGSEAQFFDLVKRAGESLRRQCGAGEPSAEDLAATRASEPSSTESARFYAEGLAKFREFDALAARDLLVKAVDADPNHAMAHSALAAVWSLLGYDEKATQESKRAFELSAKLSRKEKLSIEAQFRENSHEWDKAVEIYRSLWTFFPDDLEYGLRLAAAQVSAGKGAEALGTVQSLRKLPPPSRDDPRIDLAEAASADSLSDFRRELAVSTSALEKSRRQGTKLLSAQAMLQQCWAARNLGELDKAMQAGNDAGKILATAGDLRGQAQGLTCLGTVLADQGKIPEAKAMREQALALAQKIGAQKDIAGALINLGNISAAQGDVAESTRQYQQALAVAREIGDKPDLLLAQNNIGANLMLGLDFTGAGQMLHAALDTAHDTGDQSGAVNALSNLGIIQFRQGNFNEAKKSLSEALAKSRELGWKSATASLLVSSGEVALAEDDLARADQDLQEAFRIESEVGEKGGVANAQATLASLHLEKNDAAGALSLASRAAEEFQAENTADLEAMARNLVAQSLLAQGKLAEAKSELDRAHTLPVHDRYVAMGLEATSARLAGRNGRAREAVQQLDALLAKAKSLKLAGVALQLRLDEAEVQLLVRNPTVATTKLRALEQDALRGGFKLIARKARAAGEIFSKTKK